ncbi:MAG: zinc ABC transporter substrate-binding protein [Phormidesmis sp. CAN_BIN36]|nr:zinc ABC transporter substrate-binding protein [Phormidesmis sp. CAN_BIN36]
MYNALRQTWGAATLAIAVGILTSCSASAPTSQTSPTSSATGTTASVPATPNTGIKVVATSTVLCDLTKQIAASTVDLTCLIKPASDPHVYQPAPEDRKAIEDANLVMYSGYDFEPSLIKLIKSTSNSAPKVAIAEVAVPTPQQFDEDGKTVPDPHVWHNAQNGVQMVAAIQSSLAKVAPANAALYAKNAQAVTAELTQIDGWIKSQIATIPEASRKLVTTHDALGYYSKAYEIPVEGALEGVSTEEKPTANRVKELVKTIKADKVPTIFPELTINPKLIDAVAKEANVKVSDRELYADGLGEAGSEGDTYQKMLVANTKTIVEGLGGKFAPLAAK